jgi:hypothetical protein
LFNGWGWTPVRWQGWLTILAAVAFIVWNGLSLESLKEPTGATLFWFFVKTLAALAVLLIICYKKREKPGWQWGPPKNKN